MASQKFKQFKVDFYVVTLDQDRTTSVLKDMLSAADGITDALTLNAGEDEHFQIRSIVSINKGMAYKAVFGRCRFGETPEQGAVDGREADVELKPGHGLVEKNYFLFFPETNLVVYQRNSSGSHYSKFQRYLGRASGHDGVTFEPILTSDSYERLLTPGVQAKRVDISFQQPKDPSLYRQAWTKDAIRLVNSAGGVTARITIGVGRTHGKLLSQAKDAAVMLARAGLAKVARVKVEEQNEPIDLIADRVVETAQALIGDNGRPIPEMVYAALDRAKTKRKKDLDTFFGT
ncbi:hypothetical protein CAL29_28195 [Bordetella genomosp. 10]|uniref:Uncharacterized protein n=1 Tax=Bordetella genomosp. 10 TaxID=1416804 RepID=A0A261S5P3_9BORD|nr:DUF6731 family protein [Bordetella genomosp. 10]OZI31753.1 hypothetical protein CAL29_28195 [Bordetella genomosp. 10]